MALMSARGKEASRGTGRDISSFPGMGNMHSLGVQQDEVLLEQEGSEGTFDKAFLGK